MCSVCTSAMWKNIIGRPPPHGNEKVEINIRNGAPVYNIFLSICSKKAQDRVHYALTRVTKRRMPTVFRETSPIPEPKPLADKRLVTCVEKDSAVAVIPIIAKISSPEGTAFDYCHHSEAEN
jgi:hypothetical protein